MLQGVTTMIADIAKALMDVAKKAPAYFAISMLTAGLLWSAASTQFASADDLTQVKSEITKGFTMLTKRQDVSDAERVVDDLQSQIRQKERELADMQLVLDDTASGNSVGLIRGRVFTLKQDLVELQSDLSNQIANLQQARREYNQAR